MACKNKKFSLLNFKELLMDDLTTKDTLITPIQ